MPSDTLNILIKSILVPLALVAGPALAVDSEPIPAAPVAAPENPAAKKKEVPKVVMAKVGETEITVEQFMKYISTDGRLVRMAMDPQKKPLVLRDLIENELIEQAMRREGLLQGENPTQVEKIDAFHELKKKHFPAIDPDEAHLREFFEANKEKFGIPAQVRLSQIQVRYPREATDEQKAAVKARAEEALARVRKGEDFAAVADEYTENRRGKGKGGDVGFVDPKTSEWLQKAIAGLKVGEHTGLLESPVGYEILKLTDTRPAKVQAYDDVRDAVEKAVRDATQELLRRQYMHRLAREIGVEILMPELEAAMP